jgi:hypothetical protein
MPVRALFLTFQISNIMAQIALYIGIKDGKRQLIEEGDPRDIRHRFKHSDGEGFDALEVFESTVGRSRRRVFVKDSAAPAPAKVAAPGPVVIPDEEETAEAEPVADDAIENLISIAKGDGRKVEVKEAREKLDELGVAY